QDARSEREAETCFRRAMDIASRQQARSLELRAATSLGRLLERRGEREEGRRLLAEVYAWFTEGFDTADFRDARPLLAALAPGSQPSRRRLHGLATRALEHPAARKVRHPSRHAI